MSITINRLQEAFNTYQSIYELSSFYEQREKVEYIVDAFEPIKRFIDIQFTDRNKDYKYSIWGLTQMSSLTVNYISRNYPNAKLMHVYDTFRKIVFEGMLSESPEEIRKHPDEIVILTSNGPNKSAKKMFDEIEKEENSYFLFELIK